MNPPWLKEPNPNGKSNAQVVKPWANGKDIAGRPSDTWIIDFGTSMNEEDASFFECPYEHALQNVKPYRQKASRSGDAGKWWLHERARASLREAIQEIDRFIVTVRVAKHRFFVWLPSSVLPDTRLCVIPRSDDCTFGILSCRIHTVWALANASVHGDGVEGGRPTYNGKSCFETFPFPDGLTPKDTKEAAPSTEVAKSIAIAAKKLDEVRNNWLNPSLCIDWVQTPEEVSAGFPMRPVAKKGFEEKVKKLTLTNLYNKPPSWLTNVHQALDLTVAKAYGWEDYTPKMSDEEILKRLLEINLKRNKSVPLKSNVRSKKK